MPFSLSRSLPAFLIATSLTLAAGCHAQNPPPAPGAVVAPELAHRIDILVRQKAQLPPGSSISIGPRTPSTFNDFDQVAVTIVSLEGTSSHPIEFLLSKDGKQLGQFTKWDISGNARDTVAFAGRPFRGGPESAPVVIVGFDDLECPYCARLHSSIFPAINNRYKDQVRVVYRDFPLDQHPWAMRAAVDTNCLAAQSNAGYWNEVDYIHAHGDTFGTPADPKGTQDKTLPRAVEQLDALTREQGRFQKADMPKLDACIAKQDTSAIEESKKIATGLGVDSTPSLFINGEKIDGAVPLDFLFKQIDQALVAAGATPPAPFVPPTPPAPSKPAAAAAPTAPAK